MQNVFKTLKYTPKATTSIIFLLLMIAVFALFQGRKYADFQIRNIETFLPEFYTHISNFCISYLLYAGIGYFWLIAGVKFRYIIALGLVFLASNFIYELFIAVLNTPDIVDAYYGSFGTAVAFLFLLLCWKFGFHPTPNANIRKT